MIALVYITSVIYGLLTRFPRLKPTILPKSGQVGLSLTTPFVLLKSFSYTVWLARRFSRSIRCMMSRIAKYWLSHIKGSMDVLTLVWTI